VSKQKPSTQKEMIEQLWYTVVGTNGEGMLQQLKDNNETTFALRKDFDKFVLTRLETCPIRKTRADKVGAWSTRTAIVCGIAALILEIIGVI